MEAIDIEGTKNRSHPHTNDIRTVPAQYNSSILSLHLEIKTRHGQEHNAFNSQLSNFEK